MRQTRQGPPHKCPGNVSRSARSTGLGPFRDSGQQGLQGSGENVPCPFRFSLDFSRAGGTCSEGGSSCCQVSCSPAFPGSGPVLRLGAPTLLMWESCEETRHVTYRLSGFLVSESVPQRSRPRPPPCLSASWGAGMGGLLSPLPAHAHGGPSILQRLGLRLRLHAGNLWGPCLSPPVCAQSFFLFPTHFHKIIKEKHQGDVPICTRCFSRQRSRRRGRAHGSWPGGPGVRPGRACGRGRGGEPSGGAGMIGKH